ncbi:MAG: glycosyltransferase [Spirochaetota bacterium]
MEQIALLQQLFLWSALVYWLSGFLLLWRIPPVRPRQDSAKAAVGDISIVIPARNEAGNIGVLLESLTAQQSRPLEVFVVDDQSEDGTAEIAWQYSAAAPWIRVIQAADRPGDWTGKNWSCHCGAAAAKGSSILFLDADTRLEAKDALERLAAEHSQRGGMVSVQPYHRVHKLYEQLSGFFNLIVMVGSGAFDLWSRSGDADGCFGPCILTDRNEYSAVGGHAAVRGEVVDDLALCALFRRHGLGVHCFGGRGLISFRMYPGGLRSLIEGWTKNMAMGASLSKLRNIILLVVWFTGISNALLAVAVSSGPGAAAVWSAAAAGVYGLYAVQVYLQLRRVGGFSVAAALLFPLEFLFFVGVFVYSIIRTKLFGSVSWKGRSITIGNKK